MNTELTGSFNDLVERLLGDRIPESLAAAVRLPELPAETHSFIRRMLLLMKKARYPAANFNPTLINWVTTTIPSVLPGAWGGRIPPITVPRRHEALDAYVARQAGAAGAARPLFVDVGCGFPPDTTADTARNLPGWQVYGVDRAFAAYVLYDPDGHYACFDEDGRFQYFQGLMNSGGRALYQAPQETRRRFTERFEALCPLLGEPDPGASKTVARDGHRLIRDHLHDFETENLHFFPADIMALEIPPARAIRCMNVLLYFKQKTRQELLRRLAGLLDEGGLLITGTNGLAIQTRYAVYRKQAGELVPVEFAFSLDNLGPISFMPWFTIREDDPEAAFLAALAAAVRKDAAVWPDFSGRLDALFQDHGICRRCPDGFFRFPRQEPSLSQFLTTYRTIWRQVAAEGYTGRCVKTLSRAGFEAWENPVGDVAVRPLPAPFWVE